ncbi:hemicentin-1-like isoform X1 [Epinephelus fuscoguttatus]|uniref:hemicentin-1-like isoform X1 n=1 Tax=Epinephelus fuscoguttatus TaxID=293821 RepID=UPI0020D1A133|nr:hemicentin-1-like isoform X1 [Epinephelus fuscoguttatus]
MGFKVATVGILFFFLSVSVIQGQNNRAVTYTSTQICALAGSTVDIRCSYTYPSGGNDPATTVTEKLWFTKGGDFAPVDLTTDAEYAGRVQYSSTDKDCTLRITDLRESDSAVYKFMFITHQPDGRFIGSPGVTLSVTALQVRSKVFKPSVSSVHAELSCESTCQLPGPPTYFWYISGKSSIKGQTKEGKTYETNFYYKDSFACAIRGFEEFASRPECAHNRYCNIVSYNKRSICAFKGSSVDISCSYYGYELGLYLEFKFWFSPGRSHQWQNPSQPEDLTGDPRYAGRVQFKVSGRVATERGLATLSINDLRESDSAEYRFKFKAQRFEWQTDLPGTTLTVAAPRVQVTKAVVQQSVTEAELRCQSSCSPAGRLSYVWFKNGEIVKGVTYSYRGQFHLEDIISCAFKGYENHRSPSVYAPKLPSVSARPSADVAEGSSVTLTCSSDANPAAKYTWYKENGNPDLKPLSNKPQLVLSSVQSSDSGQYYCTAENELGRRTSGYIFISVKYAPKLPSVSVSPSAEIVEGSSVTLTCSSDANPAAKYTWYKKNGNPNLKPLSTEPQLVFSSIQSSDSGQYYCTAENELGRRTSESISIDVKYAPKLPSVSVSPSAEIVEGSSVTLTCSSDANPAAKYTWYKKNQNLPQGPEGIYHFTSISSEDRGLYYCKSENQYGWISSDSLFIDVLYAPKLPSVSVSPSAEIMEGWSVTLTCSSDANPAAKYTWYKEDQTLHHGQEGIHHFTSISSEDRGFYYCKSENQHGRIKSSGRFIDVQYAPKLPSVSVSPSAEIVEGSSVTLTCSSDANPAANYTWYKTVNPRPLSEGPQLVFSSIQSSDSGQYYCTAENKLGRRTSNDFTMDVKYAPKLPSVSVSPSAEIVEGSSVTLTCSSDANPAANYTWYKNNQTLLQGSEGIYHFTSISSEDSGSYHCMCQNQHGRINSTSLFVNVQYAPKLPSVSVSPSAEIVEGSSVTLTCSSDANPAANYTWYKENQTLHHGPENIYPFPNISLKDSGIYYCKSENKYGKNNSTAVHIDVQYAPKLPSVSVSPSAEIVEGSSVTLTCSSDANPAANYTWYKKTINPRRLSEGPQLVFSSIQSSDSGQYYCTAENELGRRTSNDFTMDVKYAPRVPSVSVNPSGKITEGSSVTLTCSSDANPAAKKTWYMENQKVLQGSDGVYQFMSISSEDRGKYYCTSENQHGRINSSSIFIDVQYAPKLPSVSVSPSAEIVEGSSVTLTCSSDANPAAKYTWYKENQTLHHGPENIYPFPNISLKDSGIYYCKSENKYGKNNSTAVHIDVQYAPKLPSVSVSPSAEIVEGSSVTLTCSSDANPAAKYTWYKKTINPRPLSEEPQLVFSSIQSSDSGQYYCTAENELGRRTSNDFTMDVKYSPRVPSVSVNPSGKIMEGSSVTLTCSSDANPAAKKTWYMENQKVLQGSDGVYQFMSISSEDRGKYYCTSENQHGRINSSSIFIDVQYAPKLPSVSVSPSAEIVEGSSVTLTCSSDANPAAKYTWYKKTINPRPLSEEPQLVFSSIQSSDSGQYYCTAENELGRRTSNDFTMDVKYAPRVPSVSVNPSGKIMEGSSVTLTCSSDAKPAAKKTWYMENQKVLQGSDGVYQFMSISSEDRGKYYCTSENQHGRINSSSIFIDVQYAPKLPSVSVSPSAEIVEGSSVTLTCSSDANPAAKYTWYKKTINPRRLSEEPQLVFSSIQSSDSGQYYCTAENELGRRTSNDFTMDVKYAPRVPSVSVNPSGKIMEGSSVTLTCSSDANPAAKKTWYMENQKVLQGSDGVYQFMSISSEDRGKYYCTSENQHGRINSSSIFIDVQYAPKLPSVSVSPSAEIVEGSSVTLTCSSDANPAANYTWYKEDEDSPKASGHIFTITDITAEHSGNYYCEVQNTRGRHNSTLHLIVVADKSTMIITIISLTLVVMLILLLLFCLWIRKKKTLSCTSEPNEPKETPELVQNKSAAETEDTKEEEEMV